MTLKKRITIYVSDSEYEAIKELAKKHSVSMVNVITGCVYYYLKHDKYPGMKFDFRGWWYH